jgi:hypothetical protein
MSPEVFQKVESVALEFTLVALLIVVFFAIHDVLSKNDVPKIGRFVVYGVLGLGVIGFIAKGLIELFWVSQGL